MIYNCKSLKLIIATNNKGKFREICQLLSHPSFHFLSLDEAFGSKGKKVEVIEDGVTFEENALKKAKEIAILSDCYAISDDSGLEVDVLDGEPGVHSAVFAGASATDEENVNKLLSLLHDMPHEKRRARFRCVAAFYSPEGLYFTADGVCDGRITEKPRGSDGFGYDPVFIPDGYDRTFAELPISIKNRVSHRGKAFTRLRRKIIDYFDL